jgi:hypothetical protein
MKHRDVAIHTNSGIFGNEEETRKFPPIQQRIDLSKDIWLGRLDSETARLVMDTCEPRVFGAPLPVRQFAQLYSFVRELPEQADLYRWDDDNELTAVVGLSRLIHPTFIGFAYAARVGYEADGVKQIFPAQIKGINTEAFLSPNRKRDWLTDAEASQLGGLVPFLQQQLPKRLHNALWHHEYASRTYFLDHRWTLVCTGLEALLHTDRTRNTAQFTRRVPALAAELGVSISEAEAVEGYDLRSRLAHGVSFLSTGTGQGPTTSQLQLYDRLEDTLRTAVLRGMQDKSFGDIFSDEAQIRKRWPI